ncbi:hypothetical protein Tsubulata_004698 [Turnera subulata]|uniref:BZIP domain-containing protein n=1 Tax=Turnera subulata TaxID=218843 RepID=A0A9Q0FMM2_9ROSI|nr:hypothetical protein Tsubulata_004698 [Turnera subulata]
MATFKVMASPKQPTTSDLSTTTTTTSSRPRAPTKTPQPNRTTTTTTPLITPPSADDTMTVDGMLRNPYASPPVESTLLDAQITLIDTPAAPLPFDHRPSGPHLDINDALPPSPPPSTTGKTVDEVWREIVHGRREMKEEQPDEMMTLEDFLAKAGAVPPDPPRGDDGDGEDVKMALSERLSGGVFSFDPSPSPSAFHMLDKMEGSVVAFGSSGGSGNGRGKRGRAAAAAMEPMDKAAQQRQRRMIKNRESAARSRERKQAYQVELESLAVRLEEENEQLLKEKEERTKERFKQVQPTAKVSEDTCFLDGCGNQLMEKVIPVEEKRRPKRVLRRVNSMQW